MKNGRDSIAYAVSEVPLMQRYLTLLVVNRLLPGSYPLSNIRCEVLSNLKLTGRRRTGRNTGQWPKLIEGARILSVVNTLSNDNCMAGKN